MVGITRSKVISFSLLLAGGMRPSCKRMPAKLCMMVEAGADHPGVPALL